VGTHELRGIEKTKGQEWRCYGQRETCWFIAAEGNGKTRGQISCEEVQELTAVPRGRLDCLTYGAFPDARR